MTAGASRRVFAVAFGSLSLDERASVLLGNCAATQKGKHARRQRKLSGNVSHAQIRVTHAAPPAVRHASVLVAACVKLRIQTQKVEAKGNNDGCPRSRV